jgi:hypothetical protein
MSKQTKATEQTKSVEKKVIKSKETKAKLRQLLKKSLLVVKNL